MAFIELPKDVSNDRCILLVFLCSDNSGSTCTRVKLEISILPTGSDKFILMVVQRIWLCVNKNSCFGC